jgi:hypothetical protein
MFIARYGPKQLQHVFTTSFNHTGETQSGKFPRNFLMQTTTKPFFSQIYASRKIKHPSFRKRASSGTMPYYIPFRHRQRTKSESAEAPHSLQNQDSSMDCENINSDKIAGSMETDNSINFGNLQFNKIKISQLKKSKSMESLLPPRPDESKESKVNSSSSTLEFVSSRIQKLKFNE